jgi:hypothetical protein
VLGEVQDLRAVGEERRTPLPEIETSRIELGECSDELRHRMTFVTRELGDARE